MTRHASLSMVLLVCMVLGALCQPTSAASTYGFEYSDVVLNGVGATVSVGAGEAVAGTLDVDRVWGAPSAVVYLVAGLRDGGGSWVGTDPVVVYAAGVPGPYPGVVPSPVERQLSALTPPQTPGTYKVWLDLCPDVSASAAIARFKSRNQTLNDSEHRHIGDVTLGATDYTLTLTKCGGGDGGILINGHARGLPYSGSFASGTVLTLTAVADDACGFVCWSGDASGNANPIVLSMTADRDVDVRFEPTVKTRFTTSPKAVPVYIDAIPHDTPYYPSFGAGSTHTVGVASPVTLTDYIRLTFSHWDPAADQWHVLTWPSVGMKYTAYYDAQLKVTAEVSPPGSGTATLTPDAPGGWYSPGSGITFHASPAPAYEFWHWEFVKLGKTKNNPVMVTVPKAPIRAIAHMLPKGSGLDRPKAVSPVGEVPLAAVTFVWEGVDGARCYDLWVSSKGSDAPVLTLDGVAACKTGAVGGLPAGDYEWWVRAHSGEGTSGWSVPAHFSLRPEALRQLPAPKPLAPLGEVGSGALTFRWTSVPGAASYSLWVARASDGWPVCRRAGIAGAQCEVSLPAGKYRWAVSAGGPWSASVTLQVE